VEPLSAKSGETFKITAEISGGKPPHDYTISFKPEAISAVNKRASDGKVSDDFTVPSGISPGTTLDAAIKVKDQAGASVDVDKPVKLTVGQ
jgi:hypothetical protein